MLKNFYHEDFIFTIELIENKQPVLLRSEKVVKIPKNKNVDFSTTTNTKPEKIIINDIPYSKRMLQFKRDTNAPLIKKLKNKKYFQFKDEIYNILKTRYAKALKDLSTERNKKTLTIISKFYQECFDEIEKSTEIQKSN